jgi:hypothetical protein
VLGVTKEHASVQCIILCACAPLPAGANSGVTLLPNSENSISPRNSIQSAKKNMRLPVEAVRSHLACLHDGWSFAATQHADAVEPCDAASIYHVTGHIQVHAMNDLQSSPFWMMSSPPSPSESSLPLPFEPFFDDCRPLPGPTSKLPS